MLPSPAPSLPPVSVRGGGAGNGVGGKLGRTRKAQEGWGAGVTAWEPLGAHSVPRQVRASQSATSCSPSLLPHSFKTASLRPPYPPHCGRGRHSRGGGVPPGWLMRLDTVHVNAALRPSPRPRSPPENHDRFSPPSPSTICRPIGSCGFLNPIKFLISPPSIISFLNRHRQRAKGGQGAQPRGVGLSLLLPRPGAPGDPWPHW